MALLDIHGKCHCGAVQFKARIDPHRVMACHCTDCQILSGAPLRAGVAATIENFSLTGEVKEYIKTSQSGNRRAQVFCPTCATPLFSKAAEDATTVMVRAGCLAEKDQLKPALNIWKRSSLRWLNEIESLPSSQQQEVYLPAQEG